MLTCCEHNNIMRKVSDDKNSADVLCDLCGNCGKARVMQYFGEETINKGRLLVRSVRCPDCNSLHEKIVGHAE